jgi:hypothetical protein
MILELSKAASFLLSILSLFHLTVRAFFYPEPRWQERLILALPSLALATAICLLAGLLFRWPARHNPDAHQPFTETLPVRIYLWTIPTLAILFTLCCYILWQRECSNAWSMTCAG